MTQVIIAVLTALTVIGPAIVARLAMGPGHDIKVLRELTAAINELEHPSLSRALLESARDEQASRITLRTHLAESRKRHAVTLPFSVTASIGAFVVSYHAMQQEDRLLMVGGFVLLITGLVLFAVTVRGVQLLVSTADPVPLLPKRRRRGREERSEKEDEEESGQGYAPPSPIGDVPLPDGGNEPDQEEQEYPGDTTTHLLATQMPGVGRHQTACRCRQILGQRPDLGRAESHRPPHRRHPESVESGAGAGLSRKGLRARHEFFRTHI